MTYDQTTYHLEQTISWALDAAKNGKVYLVLAELEVLKEIAKDLKKFEIPDKASK